MFKSFWLTALVNGRELMLRNVQVVASKGIKSVKQQMGQDKCSAFFSSLHTYLVSMEKVCSHIWSPVESSLNSYLVLSDKDINLYYNLDDNYTVSLCQSPMIGEPSFKNWLLNLSTSYWILKYLLEKIETVKWLKSEVSFGTSKIVFNNKWYIKCVFNSNP